MGKRNRQPRNKPSKEGASKKTNSTKSRSGSTISVGDSGSMSILGILFRLLLPSLVKLVLCTVLAAPFWFLTYSLAVVYGRPPKMVYIRQTVRYLGYTWFTPNNDHVSLSFATRLDSSFRILQHTMTSPISGFCWLLDEVLYARQMENTKISKPLFIVSGYRSASTEMARVLHHQDPNTFVAPCAAMCNFPFLWLWKLLSWLFEKAEISKQEAAGYLTKNFSSSSLERHDHNPFEVDTFDGSFLSSHLNGLSLQMTPHVTIQEFHSAEYGPHASHLMQHDFVRHVDRIARKTMLFYNASQKIFLLKGHFLASAPALSLYYKDARFLTILRNPLDRIESAINDMATNPTLGKPNWQWLTTAFIEIETRYCEREMEFYNSNENNGRRLAVRFDLFVGKEFVKTLHKIYQELLPEQNQVPNFVPIHGKKKKKQYTIHKSLEELGVDVPPLKERLTNYNAWIKSM